MYVLGIDIGGTKVAVGLVSSEGEVIGSKRMPTRAEEGPSRVIERFVELCRKSVAKAGVDWQDIHAVGVGCGGPLDPCRGLIQSPPNLPGWDNIPLVEQLQGEFDIPVYLDNDANAAALGEHRFGAGRGVANMVYMTVSTGVGGGVIADGRLLRGENGNAAELGHLSVVWDGRPCLCGSRGCLEAYASGTAIAARAQELVLGHPESLLRTLVSSAEEITAKTVAQALEQGDPVAEELWQETTEILGAGVANVISAFNPRLVVLGGGITNFGARLFDPVRRIAKSRLMPSLAAVVDIVPAELGDEVGVVGAAAVALERMAAPPKA